MKYKNPKNGRVTHWSAVKKCTKCGQHHNNGCPRKKMKRRGK